MGRLDYDVVVRKTAAELQRSRSAPAPDTFDNIVCVVYAQLDIMCILMSAKTNIWAK